MPKRKRTQVQLRADKISQSTLKAASSVRYQSPSKGLAPSDHWSGFGQWEADSDYVRSVRKVLDEASFDSLCSIALEARKPLLESQQAKRRQPKLSCSIDETKFTCGRNNVVVEVTFSDQVYWIARIELRRDEKNAESDAGDSEGEDNDHQNLAMLSEIATMRVVRERTTIPVPQIFAHSATSKNPLGYRYILMEAMNGHVLEESMSCLPSECQDKVASQFAHFLFELSNVRFDRIGRLWCGTSGNDEPEIIPFETVDGGPRGIFTRQVGPLDSSLEYFYQLREGMNRALNVLHPDDQEWAMAGWVLKHALPFIVTEANLEGPFPLRHMDMHYKNILVDDEYNITGIIDWTNACTVPIELFAVIPELAMGHGAPEDIKAKTRAFGHRLSWALKQCEEGGDRQQINTDPDLDSLITSSESISGVAQGRMTMESHSLSTGADQDQAENGKRDSEDGASSSSVNGDKTEIDEISNQSAVELSSQRLSSLVAAPRTELVRRCFDTRLTIAKFMARLAASLLYGANNDPLSGGIAWEQLKRSYELANVL